jgi:hypothetical protein
MTRILFFAAGDDLRAVLHAVETESPVKYTQTGRFPTHDPITFLSCAAIPDLGKANASTAGLCTSYLVSEPTETIRIRRIDKGPSDKRFAVDQLMNQKTVVLTPAGCLNSEIVLHGSVATVSKSPEAQVLMRRFLAAFKNNFNRIEEFWLGPQAYALLENGKRLTIAQQSPRDFDLSLPSSS